MTNDVRPWIAIIYSAIEPTGRRGGGIHNAVMAQALALEANGIGVTVFTSSEAFAAEAEARSLRVALDRAWHSGIDPLLSRRTWRQTRRHNGVRPAAVIHHNGRTWFAGAVLFPGVLQAQVMHRETVPPYRFYRHWLALSHPYAAFLRSGTSGRLRKIAVAPNGLPEAPQPLLQKNRPTDRILVGASGRLSKAKGTNLIIEAAAILKADGANIHFKIAGPSPEPFIALADQKGVSDRVEFVGWIDQMNDFLDELDIFCLASEKESFGLVLIEAMARGLPVVSTATNGARDVIGDDPVGWLTPIGDAQALATTLSTASSDRHELARRGEAAFHRACLQYTPQPVGRELIKALTSLGAPLRGSIGHLEQ